MSSASDDSVASDESMRNNASIRVRITLSVEDFETRPRLPCMIDKALKVSNFIHFPLISLLALLLAFIDEPWQHRQRSGRVARAANTDEKCSGPNFRVVFEFIR